MRSLLNNFFLVLLFFGAVVSCTTTSPVRKVDTGKLSLTTLMKVVESTMKTVRGRSVNGREFYSNYTTSRLDPKTKVELERSYIKATILGDRRPYIIEAIVIREKRLKSGSYQMIGYDLPATDIFMQELRDRLDQSKYNRDLIDDFRSF